MYRQRMRCLNNIAHALSQQPSIQIDLSRYSTGIYIIKLVNGDKVFAVGKVVKE